MLTVVLIGVAIQRMIEFLRNVEPVNLNSFFYSDVFNGWSRDSERYK